MTTEKDIIKISDERNNERAGDLGTELVDELENWTEDFTMHGFKIIMKAEYIATRIVWIILTMGMVVYCICCK